MTISKTPGATLEEIDAAIAEAGLAYSRVLNALHGTYLNRKAKARRDNAALVKKLLAYRAIIELEEKGSDA